MVEGKAHLEVFVEEVFGGAYHHGLPGVDPAGGLGLAEVAFLGVAVCPCHAVGPTP